MDVNNLNKIVKCKIIRNGQLIFNKGTNAFQWGKKFVYMKKKKKEKKKELCLISYTIDKNQSENGSMP